jgi:hypothetical protein
MDVQHLPGFQLSESDLHLAEKRPVKLQTVLSNMNDDDAKSQFLEVVFEFKTPVHHDQGTNPALEERRQFPVTLAYAKRDRPLSRPHGRRMPLRREDRRRRLERRM